PRRAACRLSAHRPRLVRADSRRGVSANPRDAPYAAGMGVGGGVGRPPSVAGLSPTDRFPFGQPRRALDIPSEARWRMEPWQHAVLGRFVRPTAVPTRPP